MHYTAEARATCFIALQKIQHNSNISLTLHAAARRALEKEKGEVRGLRYGCLWPGCSCSPHWPFKPEASKNLLLRLPPLYRFQGYQFIDHSEKEDKQLGKVHARWPPKQRFEPGPVIRSQVRQPRYEGGCNVFYKWLLPTSMTDLLLVKYYEFLNPPYERHC